MMDPDDISNRLLAAVHFSHNGTPFTFWDFGNILGDGRLSVANTAFSNQWEHYVFTTGSNGMFIYQNGLLVNGTMNSDMLMDRTRNVLIGGGQDVNNVPFYFDGKLDDIVFFDKQLDLSEVNLLYQFGGLCSTVGIEESVAGGVHIYPTVTRDYLHVVTGDAGPYPVFFRVTDLAGKIVMPESLLDQSAGEITVSISEIPAGIYLAEFLTGGKSVHRKFIKQ